MMQKGSRKIKKAKKTKKKSNDPNVFIQSHRWEKEYQKQLSSLDKALVKLGLKEDKWYKWVSHTIPVSNKKGFTFCFEDGEFVGVCARYIENNLVESHNMEDISLKDFERYLK